MLDSAKEIDLVLNPNSNKLFDKWQNDSRKARRQHYFFDEENAVASITDVMSAEKRYEVEVFNCMLDKYISSTDERIHALKMFHSNFKLLFCLMDDTYLSQLPENNCQSSRF